MIDSIGIQHFRCFQQLNLSGLRRINVIVGRNAAGKTALLEGIRLALGGTPSVAWSLNQQRGLLVFYQPTGSREQFEAQWNAFFHGLDATKPIQFNWTDSENRDASLSVSYDPTKAITPGRQFMGPVAPQPISTIVPLKFERQNLSGEKSTLHATVDPNNGQLNLMQGPEIGPAVEFFTSSWFYNPQQSAAWFSQLSVQNKESELVETMRREFLKDITDLSILAPLQVAVVYASMPYAPKKLPLALVSSGINKFFTVLSALLTHGGGVVLLDEMENGLYYDRLPAFWATLLRVTSINQTQLFVSTHSWECLQAAKDTIKLEPESFSLIRLEHGDNGSIARQFAGADLEAAIEQEMEIR